MKKIEFFRTGLIATSTDILLQGMIKKINETIHSVNEIIDFLEKNKTEYKDPPTKTPIDWKISNQKNTGVDENGN